MLMAEPFDINENSLKSLIGKPMEKPKLHPKLKGQRLGQVVWNALYTELHDDSVPKKIQERNAEIAERLYYISDEDLTKLINDYLKET